MVPNKNIARRALKQRTFLHDLHFVISRSTKIVL